MSVVRTHEEHLAHYGILRRSGRYPWGSGASETTRNRGFLDYVENLKKDGMAEKDIAKGMGVSTTALRAAKSIAIAQQRQEKILTAQRYKDHGLSDSAIGRRMGLNESSVRALLAPGAADKANAIHTTAKMLEDQVAQKKFVDIGKGVSSQIGVTPTRLNSAVAVLREKGYEVHNIQTQQLGTGKYTTAKVLALPGTTKRDLQTKYRAEIRQIDETTPDQGRTFLGQKPPLSVSSKRIAVNYGGEGGEKADGVIYIRPGVKDLHMGADRYAQVRIAVDNTHYLKGMAVYKDDLPHGVDIVFNTKAPNTGRKKDVMKPLNKDSELPFGALIQQYHDGKGKVTSALNTVGSKEGAGAEGAWDKWSRTLSSQVLSKQNPELAIGQLKLTHERRVRELAEINSLTNETVRKKLLLAFADSTDAAAVHLKAASLPRQATKVLLPISSIKPTEIYAPSMHNGERVALIRFPHGGKFEIPELTVNNKNREARRILGTAAQDAVGIHHSVAHHLSGADFDGDTVLVIPNNKRQIEIDKPLADLKGFDPHIYKIPEGSSIPRMTKARTQPEMGNISNLITDMTIKGAPNDHLARAVKHSMVVIDAEKHGLDFVASAKDQGIPALKQEYQAHVTPEGKKSKGASTLISLKKSKTYIPDRQERAARRGGSIDPQTGAKIFEPTGKMRPEYRIRTQTDPRTGEKKKVKVPTGNMIPVTTGVSKLALVDDATTLSSGTRIENIYASHSNRLKAMANDARKTALPLTGLPKSSSAAHVYAPQVATLTHKLNVAEKNAPRERAAQRLANAHLSQIRQSNPGMPKEEDKKVKTQLLNTYRARTGAHKDKIPITKDEWDAIQAGALSKKKLDDILLHADQESVKRLAMPKHTPKLTSSALRRAQTMLARGYTQAEVADQLGIGLTTLKVGLNE